MGVLPLQYLPGESADTIGLTGREQIDIVGVDVTALPATVSVRADDVEFEAIVRIDTPMELDYYHHGGILPRVVRSLVAG
jgi:aconitate hydratase